MLDDVEAEKFMASLPWCSGLPAPTFAIQQNVVNVGPNGLLDFGKGFGLVSTCWMASPKGVRIAVRGTSAEAALRFAVESWMVAHEAPPDVVAAMREHLRRLMH
jgi:hypothetical protein